MGSINIGQVNIDRRTAGLRRKVMLDVLMAGYCECEDWPNVTPARIGVPEEIMGIVIYDHLKLTTIFI